MNRRQFYALFICSLIPWWVGSGLMPLLPLYAARLGASPAVVGSYLSFIFFALATGTIFGGRLSAKSSRYREILVLVGLIGIPATWLMGQIAQLWQLILLNAAIWFVIGITLAVVAIIAGRSAAREERGRVFGLLAMTSALGGVLGGSTGIIADRWGYGILFTLVGGIWVVLITAALFLRNPEPGSTTPEKEQRHTEPSSGEPAPLAAAFWLLLIAALLFSTGGFVGTLGRSLAMEARGFSGAAITGIAALGSGFGLVLNPLFGRLSDRVNRRRLLCAIYITGALALVVTAYAESLLGFVLMAAFSAMSGTERAVSSALVSDLLSPRALSRGLSMFDAVKWLGGVLGLSGAGYLVLMLGLRHALLLGAVLPLSAVVLLILTQRREESIEPEAQQQQVLAQSPMAPAEAEMV